MNILISGICGFVGHRIAHHIKDHLPNVNLYGLDNFIRPGSEQNRESLAQIGAKVFHADIRQPSDLECIPKIDWIIDAAANPSVLAGVDGKTSTRQLVEHNLVGTINLLELCKQHHAGLILLSTSRVYSIKGLAELEVEVKDDAFTPNPSQDFPTGITAKGVAESYTTQAPVSLYGSTKIASEVLALEYGETFNLPVWINRCGVLAGAGQFGRPDQGIFSYWLHSWKQKKPLSYIGFDGQGHQVRDCLHPHDLTSLILKQIQTPPSPQIPKVINVSGGTESCRSLRQLSNWCSNRFTPHEVSTQPVNRPFDIPWMILDSSLAKQTWNWAPQYSIETILEEIAQHAEANPQWLDISAPY